MLYPTDPTRDAMSPRDFRTTGCTGTENGVIHISTGNGKIRTAPHLTPGNRRGGPCTMQHRGTSGPLAPPNNNTIYKLFNFEVCKQVGDGAEMMRWSISMQTGECPTFTL